MGSWHKALQRDGASGVDSINSVTVRRKDLLRSVLSEQEEEERKCNAGDQSSPPVVRPHHYEDFLTRMRSFKSSTWFAKPDCISATQCARFGWVNDASDRLCCTFCQSSLIHARDDTTGQALQQQLRSAHQATCPWNQPGACSPAMFLSPPQSECMGSVLEGLARRLRDNWLRVVPSLTSSPSASTVAWPTLGVAEKIPAPLKEGSKEALDITALMSGGHFCANGGKGCGGDIDRFGGWAVSVAEYVFKLMSSGEGGGPTTAERDSVLGSLRSPENCEPANEEAVKQLQLFRAYCLVLHSSLLGLDLQTEAVSLEGADGSTGILLSASCPLCEITGKQKHDAAAGMVLARSHRSFCPIVCGHSPADAEEEEGEGALRASKNPVPPGWIMVLECLLTVALGVDSAEGLLGRQNMHFCALDCKSMEQTSTRKRSLSPTRTRGNSGGNSLVESPLSSSTSKDSPFGIYKKIKCMLES